MIELYDTIIYIYFLNYILYILSLITLNKEYKNSDFVMLLKSVKLHKIISIFNLLKINIFLLYLGGALSIYQLVLNFNITLTTSILYLFLIHVLTYYYLVIRFDYFDNEIKDIKEFFNNDSINIQVLNSKGEEYIECIKDIIREILIYTQDKQFILPFIDTLILYCKRINENDARISSYKDIKELFEK